MTGASLHLLVAVDAVEGITPSLRSNLLTGTDDRSCAFLINFEKTPSPLFLSAPSFSTSAIDFEFDLGSGEARPKRLRLNDIFPFALPSGEQKLNFLSVIFLPPFVKIASSSSSLFLGVSSPPSVACTCPCIFASFLFTFSVRASMLACRSFVLSYPVLRASRRAPRDFSVGFCLLGDAPGLFMRWFKTRRTAKMWWSSEFALLKSSFCIFIRSLTSLKFLWTFLALAVRRICLSRSSVPSGWFAIILL